MGGASGGNIAQAGSIQTHSCLPPSHRWKWPLAETRQRKSGAQFMIKCPGFPSPLARANDNPQLSSAGVAGKIPAKARYLGLILSLREIR